MIPLMNSKMEPSPPSTSAILQDLVSTLVGYILSPPFIPRFLSLKSPHIPIIPLLNPSHLPKYPNFNTNGTKLPSFLPHLILIMVLLLNHKLVADMSIVEPLRILLDDLLPTANLLKSHKVIPKMKLFINLSVNQLKLLEIMDLPIS